AYPRCRSRVRAGAARRYGRLSPSCRSFVAWIGRAGRQVRGSRWPRRRSPGWCAGRACRLEFLPWRSGGREAGEHAAHVAERALHAWKGVLGVDLILQVDAALVVHLLQLFEDGGEGHVAVADIDLAFLHGEI